MAEEGCFISFTAHDDKYSSQLKRHFSLIMVWMGCEYEGTKII
jgi:hypothetical protein